MTQSILGLSYGRSYELAQKCVTKLTNYFEQVKNAISKSDYECASSKWNFALLDVQFIIHKPFIATELFKGIN